MITGSLVREYVLAQLLQHVEAAQARHLDVEQHQVEVRLREQRQRLQAVGRRGRRHSRAAAGASTGRRGWLRYRRRPAARRGRFTGQSTHVWAAGRRSSRAAARIESAWNRNRRAPAASDFSRSSVMACALNTMIGMWRVAASCLQLAGRFPAVDHRQARDPSGSGAGFARAPASPPAGRPRPSARRIRGASRRRLSASRLGSLSSTRRIVNMFASREIAF